MLPARSFALPWLVLLCGILAVGGGVPFLAVERTVGIAVSHGALEYGQAADAAVEQLGATNKIERVDLKPGSNKTAIERLLARGPSVIITIGAPAVRELRKLDHEIPLVYAMVLDPAALDLPSPGEAATDLATGVSMSISLESQFAAMRAMLPDQRRIGVIYDPENSGSTVARAREVAKQFDFNLVGQVVRSEGEVLGAMRVLTAKIDALWSVPDATVLTRSNALMLVLQSLRARKPFFSPSRGYVVAGAFAAVTADPASVGRRAAEMAGLIAAGAGSEALPPEIPPSLIVFYNRSTADRLGMALPPAVLGSSPREAGR